MWGELKQKQRKAINGNQSTFQFSIFDKCFTYSKFKAQFLISFVEVLIFTEIWVTLSGSLPENMKHLAFFCSNNTCRQNNENSLSFVSKFENSLLL